MTKMPTMALKPTTLLPILLVGLILFARPSYAFGAGNIASTARIEGQNWRHGDIEDTLLTLLTARAMGGKKFSKLDVKRVYFGNWLRDYSQAVDVGTVKYVSAEAIRLLLWILGFMSFGFGTGEFEVTSERLGCYRPEEHIDNPKHYADDQDARQYDRRLRGPIDERRELSIDQRTGLKNYIASEDLGITTSAGLVRNLFGRAIDLGRRYKHSHDKRDFYEALRLLGTGCHCLEDYSAHSNYTELALIEMGERDVFPHVGRRTQMQVQGARNAIYPIITGTFGGVDFLHSVMGEFSDKATQSELQELEGTISQAQNQDTSFLKALLNKVPPGVFGDDTDQAGKADQLQANAAAAQMQNMHITPKEPEAFTRQIEELQKQIYPILEFHDHIMKGITETIDKIPILPDLIEQLQEQVSIFVFSLLAPFVLPIITQVKNELRTGSSEIIQSSKEQQLKVFHDDHDTDPTHSMLSKDHFSNVLNEPAGKVASAVLKWAVPQIVACWDDERVDIGRQLNRIISGVFHHPALRAYGDDGARDGRMIMFQEVEKWWGQMGDRERNDMRDKLSRDGVMKGRNHKEGVHDSGHGCGKPLGLPNMKTSQSSGAVGGNPAAAILGGLGSALGGGGIQHSSGGQRPGFESKISDTVGEAVGGGALGSILGGVAGAVGGGLLGGAFSENKRAETNTYQSGGYSQDGSYTSRVTETGHRPGGYSNQSERYGQAEVTETQYASGGYREDYQRYEQDGRSGRAGYGFEQSTETRPSYGGGYEQRTERRFERPGGAWDSEVQEQRVTSDGRQYAHQEHHHGNRRNESDDSDSNDDDDWEKKEKKRKKKEEKRLKKLREEQEKRGGYGSSGRRRSRSRSHERKRHSGGHGGSSSYARNENEYPSQQPSYGQQYGSGGGYGQQNSYSRPEQYNEYGRETSSYDSGNRYEQSSRQDTYGRSSGGGYGESRPTYAEEVFGRSGGGGYEQPSRSSYGQQEYGGGDYQQSSGYNRSEQQGYGGGDEYGRSEQRMPGGFGDDEFRERRERYEGGSSGGYAGGSSEYGEGYGGGSRW